MLTLTLPLIVQVLSEEDEEGEAPQLPHAPPPLKRAAREGTPHGEEGRPTSPTYAKKGGLSSTSPPISPTPKRPEHGSPVSYFTIVGLESTVS